MPVKDRLSPRISGRRRLLSLAPVTCLLLSAVLPAGEVETGGLAQAELRRRAANVEEARKLLDQGDEAYRDGRWADAAQAYSSARELIPDAPATRELRDAATSRYAQAAVERAREQRRLGDVKGAGDTVDAVLDEAVAPRDPGALAMRAELDDPIRTNPALDTELTKDVEEVRFLLYQAEGAYNLGDFDKARRVYESVLRVDPTNKAARRGMERTAQARADYYRSAQDSARAEMLAQVDEGWELPVAPDIEIPIDPEAGGGADAGKVYLADKLDRIIVPVVNFEDVSIEEAVDFLRAQSVAHDTLETDPTRKGVNFVLDLGPADSEVGAEVRATRINLQLRNVPISQILQYLGDITRTAHTPQDWAVIIRPRGVESTEMISRSFRVPPDFLSVANTEGAGSGDPFGGDSESEGLLARRMTPEEVLKSKGVTFPEGSSANFNVANSTLQIRNTIANVRLIEQIVEVMSAEEPAMAVIEVKVIRTQDNRLEELGYDWLLSQVSLGGDGAAPGSDALFLSGGTQDPANLSDMGLPSGEFFRRGVTSGNRSGTEAIDNDSIDGLLQETSGFAPAAARAPGIFGVTKILDEGSFSALMRGMSRKKGVDLAACPSVVARSGQQAAIRVTREFIYPTEYEPPELPNTISSSFAIDLDTGIIDGGTPALIPITPATPTSFEMREVGILLDVLPTISSDRSYIDLAIKPEVVDFDGFVNFGTPITSPAPPSITSVFEPGNRVVELTDNAILMPVFSTLRTEQNLTIRNGATIVIGGLLQDKIQKVQDKTPILGDIPVVGRLFRNDAYAPERTAVLIMVTVRVVDASGRDFGGN